MANYQSLKAAINAVIKANGNKEITGTVLNEVLLAMVNSLGAGYQFAGVATPSTNPGTPDQKVFYIALQAGTYTSFGNTKVPNGITIFIWDGSWTSKILFAGDGGVFDITAYNNNTKYADLAAALGTNGANVPESLRKGGMSVKFVSNSDNKYVQYRLMATTWSTTVTDWQGVDDEPTAGSNNLVTSGGIATYVNEEIAADASGWTDIEFHGHKEYSYRVTKTNATGTLSLFYAYKNGVTVAVSGFDVLTDKDAFCVVKFASDVDAIKVWSDSFVEFSIRLDKGCVERDLENKMRISEVSTDAQKALSQTEQCAVFPAISAWQEYEYAVYKNNTYKLTNLGENSLDYFTVLDEDGVNVPVTGFVVLQPGASCIISVSSKNGSKLKWFASGETEIKVENQINLIGTINTNSTQIDNLDKEVKELIAGGTAFDFSAGWSAYEPYSFKKGLQYTLKNELGEDGTVMYFSPRKNGQNVTVNGFTDLAPGQSCVITLNDDADEFRIWSHNGNTILRINEQKVDLYPDVRSLKETTDGFCKRDCIRHTLVVAKDGVEGHYTTIASVFAEITDSSYINQYEVVVYPGVYNEYELVIPPFTHIHGAAPNTAVVSSEGIDDTSNSPVFEQRDASSKISNLTIVSYNGYCIHFDISLGNSAIINENVILHKASKPASSSIWSIIGGGTFADGTKYIWRNCVFIGANAQCNAACHTSGNQLNGNTHLIFDSCQFINCEPSIGSVGGFGHYVCQLVNCLFHVGQKGLTNWYSPIRNIEDPTLYLYKKNEWQIIGGGNKNLSMWQINNGKTIRLRADYPITISGTAATVIFGYSPTYNNVKTARLDCMLTSEYYIDDTQAGMSGYSELKDVYQLWKRLGDCSVNNKTLIVTVNGVTKTYTFTENYLTTKTAQATIISAMQVVLDNVIIEAITDSGYGYDNVNMSDILMMYVTAADILKGEFVTLNGGKAINSTPKTDIVGIACEDKPIGEFVKVWTSAFRFDNDYADGEYGLDANGALDATAVNKIGFVKGYNFYLY